MTPLLIDTHVLLWLVFADPQLKPSVRLLLQEASLANQIFLSPISMWEIALKHSRGKLQLDRPIREWLTQATQLPGMHLAQLTPAIAAECAELPAAFHGDPADRIIAATARSEGFTLITHDSKLLKLANRGFLKAIAT